LSRSDEIRARIADTGKYEILSADTEGMNSYGFHARHIPLDAPAFLKVYDVDPDGPDLFGEARLLKCMTDQQGATGNLVQILDCERLADDAVLIAMEFVSGGSLLTRLRTEGELPLMDALNVTVGILHGVAQLHASNKVHRDLKPANILIDRVSRQAKIGDFGSVSELDRQGAAVRTSRRSALYIPPEGPQIHCRESDLYQVGMVLHELINGSFPPDEESYLDREALRQMRHREATSLRSLDRFEQCQVINAAIQRRNSSRKLLALVPVLPYVPDEVVRIIRKATAPVFENRYRSASEMISAIERVNHPNWRAESGCFGATGWRGSDWRIRQVGEGFVAERKKSAGWRHWRECTFQKTLFDAIGDFQS